MREIAVKYGMTISDIAVMAGDIDLAVDIAQYNGLSVTSQLTVGQVILLPERLITRPGVAGFFKGSQYPVSTGHFLERPPDLESFTEPVENNSVWSTTIQSNDIGVYRVEVIDLTNEQLIGSATVAPGESLSDSNSWMSFSTDIGISASDISDYIQGSIGSIGRNTLSLDFEGLTVIGLAGTGIYVDRIAVRLTSGSVVREVTFDERPLSFNLQVIAGAGDSIQLPLALANTQVDWGDGSVSRNTSTPSNTYTGAGTYTIKVLGTAGSLDWLSTTATSRNAVVELLQWGDLGLNYIRFRDCSNLTALPSSPITGAEGITSLNSCFRNCSSLTSIPAGLFDNCPNVTDMGIAFRSTGITSVPAALFDKCPLIEKFNSTFADTGITSIPAGLFAKNTAVTDFSFAFDQTAITSVPAGLFDNNVNVTTFFAAFLGCTSLQTLPNGLFANNTSVTDFVYCFNGCSALTAIPADIFVNITNGADIRFCFENCSSVTSGLPPLWLDTYYSSVPVGYNLVPTAYDSGGAGTPVPNGHNAYAGTVNASNYGAVPTYWGGVAPSSGKAKLYDGVQDEDIVQGAASVIDHKSSWALLINAEFNTFADFQYIIGNYEIGFTSSVWSRLIIQETIDGFRWQITDGNGNFNTKTWIYNPSLLAGKKVIILTNAGNTDMSGTDLHISNSVLTGGVLQSINFTDTGPIDSADLVIGKQRGGTIGYKGAIKKLEVLNRLPTQQEIDSSLNYGSWLTPENAIAKSDLYLDIDFNKEDGQVPTTFPNTPSYLISSNGDTQYADYDTL